MIAKMKACVDMATAADDLMKQSDRNLFAEGDKLLTKAGGLLQSLAGPFMDRVEIPQVRLERRQDWSLEGAVDLQLRRIPSDIRVCIS